MKKALVLSTVALLGLGSLAPSEAEARPRRGAAVAAGVIGGLAAGALLGAAARNAYAAPAYGYSYPAYGYGYAPYGGTVVGGYDDGYAPVANYGTTRVVRSYDYDGYDDGYAPVSSGYRWGGPVYYGW